MDELGLKPSVIAGTSIGALIGAGWAAGHERARTARARLRRAGHACASSPGKLWATHDPRH
jgi:NTE family protein